MMFLLVLLGILLLGVSLIAIGAYVWLAAKKTTAGLILIALGVIFSLIPIALAGYLTIVSSARG